MSRRSPENKHFLIVRRPCESNPPNTSSDVTID